MSEWQPAILAKPFHDEGQDPRDLPVAGEKIHVRPCNHRSRRCDGKTFEIDPNDVATLFPHVPEGSILIVCEHEILTD